MCRGRMLRYSPIKLNPKIPVTNSPRRASLLKAADSPNSTMPNPTAPTAPIPVYTASPCPAADCASHPPNPRQDGVITLTGEGPIDRMGEKRFQTDELSSAPCQDCRFHAYS